MTSTERMSEEQIETTVQWITDEECFCLKKGNGECMPCQSKRLVHQLLADLAAANERAEKAERECGEWEEREAAVCPEDFSFEEVIEQRTKEADDTLRTQLGQAVDRIKDMLEGDDGQAWDEARKFLSTLDSGEVKP